MKNLRRLGEEEDPAWIGRKESTVNALTAGVKNREGKMIELIADLRR